MAGILLVVAFMLVVLRVAGSSISNGGVPIGVRGILSKGSVATNNAWAYLKQPSGAELRLRIERERIGNESYELFHTSLNKDPKVQIEVIGRLQQDESESKFLLVSQFKVIG